MDFFIEVANFLIQKAYLRENEWVIIQDLNLLLQYFKYRIYNNFQFFN